MRLTKDVLKKSLSDWKFFCENFVKIRHPDGRIDKWKFYPEQTRYYKECTKRDIIVKPRQMGGWSTCIDGRGLHATITHEGFQYLTIYHKIIAAQKALQNLKIMYSSLPDGIRPVIDKDNVNMLSFPVLNSGISVTSCGRSEQAADEVGKSETLQFVKESEYAYYPYPETTHGSVANCVAQEGVIVIESTPNGFNDFHNRAMRGWNGLSAYKTFFTPWFAYPEYSIVTGTTLEDLGELNEEEIKLLDEEHVLPGQIAWRRFKIDELGGEKVGTQLFRRDYPSDIQSCFARMEGCLFDQDILDAYEELVMQPLPNERKDHYIYFEPIPDVEYIIGADVAGGKRKGSYCSAQIFRRDTWEQVGHIYGKWRPDIYAEILSSVGKRYNYATIAVENDGIGIGTIIRLQTLGYSQLYKHRSKGGFGEVQYEVGFPTNIKTRRIMIDDGEEVVRKMLVILHDRITLTQMRTFVEKEDGTIEAAAGCFDDAVMSLFIAIQLLKQPKFVRRVWNFE